MTFLVSTRSAELTLVPFIQTVRFSAVFSLHRSHFPDPRNAPVPRWFACLLVHMSSAGPCVCPPRHSKLRSWKHWDTLVCSHPRKSFAASLFHHCQARPAYEMRALPLSTFQNKMQLQGVCQWFHSLSWQLFGLNIAH